MRDESTSVLVVGGGLVGLSAAVFLSWRGVSTVLVERHLGSSLHPRALGFRPRTAELFRPVALDVPSGPRGRHVPRRMRVESLAGEWFEELHWSPDVPADVPVIEYSPCTSIGLAQDGLEPILRDKAVELGAELRLGTELVSFEQDDGGVRAVLRDRGGVESTVRADYLVAADGHRSPVREALGISRTGRGFMRTTRSMLFRAPLQEYVDRGVVQFHIDQPDFTAFLVAYGNDGRWMLMLHDDIDHDEDTLRAMALRAIGRDVDIEIITTGRWEVTASIAESYRQGRVFLSGDAAHTLPPSRGGFGANVGIEDAHNLAWKLAAVLSGESAPELLDSYEDERRPVALLCHDQIFARPDARDERVTTMPVIEDAAMAFGILYRSAAILGAGEELPQALRPDEWVGQPGTRAPHLWLAENESTLDLLQHGWVLLAGHCADWSIAAKHATEQTGITVTCHQLRPDEFRHAYGLSPNGATLVRPDGYIAWRSVDLPADPPAALTDALCQVSKSPACPPERPALHR
jgi:2-polyprenyl-6-methoxyphenol hydroxylase-like FAD-dependent oxidoreductase